MLGGNAPPRYRVNQLYPERTIFTEVPLADLEEPAVCLGVAQWLQARGGRKFPSREELDIRHLGRALANIALIEVIDGGADFLIRVVGDEVRRAYPPRLDCRLLSELFTELPKTIPRWRAAFRKVVETGAPLSMRIQVGSDIPEVRYSYAEAVCLPLGTGDRVEFLATFACHALELIEEGVGV